MFQPGLIIRQPFDDYPARLLRFFECEEHAERFRSGSIRFGLVNIYKEAAGVRSDQSEGVGCSVDASGTTHTTHAGNPFYLMCCADASAVDIDRLSKNFGPWIVEINDPRRLGNDLQDWLTSQKTDVLRRRFFGCARVEYTKGEDSLVVGNQERRFLRAMKQKPAKYSYEAEHRYLMLGMGHEQQDYSYVEFGYSPKYIQLLSPRR